MKTPHEQFLKQILDYNPETRVFTWKTGGHGMRRGVAGCTSNDGRIRIQINGRNYLAHRLAFTYMTGRCPDEVDHRDLNPSNNRWKNLRESTHVQNLGNTSLYPTNTSGFKGVTFHRSSGKFQARVAFKKKVHHLGSFESKELAATAAAEKRKELYGEFARHE